MTLYEFYAAVGGDCEKVLARIPNEPMVKKFARMYAEDETTRQLHDAVDAERWTDAFRAAHTLKGVAQNLGFTRLQQAASELTEAMRGDKPLADFSLLTATDAAHDEILRALGELE